VDEEEQKKRDGGNFELKKKAFKKQCRKLIEINDFGKAFLEQERELVGEEKHEAYDYLIKHFDNVSLIFRSMMNFD